MKKLKQKFIQHLYGSWWVYLFVCSCFVAGVIFGAIGVNMMDENQTSILRTFLDQVFSQINSDMSLALTTRQAIVKNLYNLGKIGLLGLTVIGFPLVLVIIFTRGFALGFTVVFLIKEKAVEGGLLVLLTVFPPNLLSLPAYILGAVTAINFSLYLIKGRDGVKNIPISQYSLGYLLVMLGLSGLMISAAFIEGYISPLMIRLLS